MKKEKVKWYNWAVWALGFIAIALLVYGIIRTFTNPPIEGDYDYCVEWAGLFGGTLHRDSLLYMCYSLSTNEFLCDYKVLDDERLMVKPILNITKDEGGLITEIVYDEPNYFNCTRWLKSKR